MGSHQRDLRKTHASAQASISARYGKWRSQMRPGSAALEELNALGNNFLTASTYPSLRPKTQLSFVTKVKTLIARSKAVFLIVIVLTASSPHHLPLISPSRYPNHITRWTRALPLRLQCRGSRPPPTACGRRLRVCIHASPLPGQTVALSVPGRYRL